MCGYNDNTTIRLWNFLANFLEDVLHFESQLFIGLLGYVIYRPQSIDVSSIIQYLWFVREMENLSFLKKLALIWPEICIIINSKPHKTDIKADISLRRTISLVLAERRSFPYDTTFIRRTDTSIRRTLFTVQMSNFHCKVPSKTDTSRIWDEFW